MKLSRRVQNRNVLLLALGSFILRKCKKKSCTKEPYKSCDNIQKICRGLINNRIDFIMKNKERIVAIYRYVKSTEERDVFIGFSQSETIYNYGYLYLSLAKLLEEFEKNNVKYEIDTTQDKFIPALYRDEAATRFAISYSPKKEIESEKGHQLKKIKR